MRRCLFVAQYDGSIRINTQIDTSGLNQGERSIKSSMGRIANTTKKIGAVFATVFAAGTIAKFGKEALDAASDLEAMESQFSQVFGNMEEDAAKSLTRVAEQAGAAEDRMKASFTKIAAFAKTTGMDTADSLALSERAMVAVADSAAFYDRSLEETTETLQSFLKGNYENDAALGLSATETTRNAAANKLYGKSFIELSESQKQLTLLQMVEDANRLSGAMGQAARESDTWTNQIGNLKQAWTGLMANIGRLVLPVATQAVKFIANVINSLSAMIAKLSTAASAFRSFSELLTGKKAQGGAPAETGGNTIPDMGDDYNTAADGAENLADATDDAAAATKKAEKAAKGYLNPLDEIHKIGEEDIEVSEAEPGKDKGTLGGMTGSETAIAPEVDYGNLAEGETILDKMGNALDAIIKRAKELAGLFKKGFFEGLGDYKPILEDLKNDIISIGQTLKEIFADPGVVSAVNRFADQLALALGQVAGSVASIGLTIAANLVGGLEKYLTQNKDRIKNYIIEMFDIGADVLKTIGDLAVAFSDIFSVFGGDTAQQITGNLIGVFAEVTMLISENAAKLGRDILNMITQPIIDNKEKIKEAIQGTLEAIEPFTSGILNAVQKVRDAVTEIYDQHLKPLFDSVASGLSEIFGKLLDGYNEYIVPVLQNLGEKFKELMEGPFGEAVDKIKEFVGKLIDALKLLWEEVLVPLFGWIADNIMPILAEVIEFIGNNVLNVLKIIIETIGDIADVLSGVIDFVVGVFTGDWEKAWTGIKKIFSGIWELIKDIVSGVWDAIKTIIIGGIDIVKSVISAGWNAVKSLTSTIWELIKNILSVAWNGLKALASTVWNGIKSVVSDAWNRIKSVTSTVWNAIKSFVSSLWGKIKSKASSVFDGIKSSISDVWNKLKTKTSTSWNEISTKLNDVWGGIKSKASQKFSNIKNIVSDTWKELKTKTSTSWDNISTKVNGVWGTMKDWASNKFGNIKSSIIGAWDSIQNKTSIVWESIKNAMKNPINAIIGLINSLLYGIQTMQNGIASALNSLRIDIPGWLQGITGYSSFGFNVGYWTAPKIPYLAQGTVVPPNKEFLAMLGDNKREPEVVSPLSTIEQAVKNAMSQMGGGQKEIVIKVPIYLDGKQITEVVVKHGKLQQASTGNNIFALG